MKKLSLGQGFILLIPVNIAYNVEEDASVDDQHNDDRKIEQEKLVQFSIEKASSEAFSQFNMVNMIQATNL